MPVALPQAPQRWIPPPTHPRHASDPPALQLGTPPARAERMGGGGGAAARLQALTQGARHPHPAGPALQVPAPSAARTAGRTPQTLHDWRRRLRRHYCCRRRHLPARGRSPLLLRSPAGAGVIAVQVPRQQQHQKRHTPRPKIDDGMQHSPRSGDNHWGQPHVPPHLPEDACLHLTV